MADHPLVAATSTFVRARLAGEPTGHDWHHSRRVGLTAAMLARREGGDPLVCRLAGLLHDVGDAKFDDGSGRLAVAHWLDHTVGGKLGAAVTAVLDAVGYRHPGADEPLSIEASCVYDADKLEWIGALGIARTFAYGGSIGRMIADDGEGVETTVRHCKLRLLGVEATLRTAAGRQLGAERHRFVVEFLERFDAEWAPPSI